MGESTRLSDIYDEAVGEVYRYLRGRCGSAGLAEELTSATFVQAALQTSRGAVPEVSVGWLITVARNRLFDALRRQLNYEDKLRLLASGKAEAIEFDIAERLRVERALSELRIDHRIVLTMHYLDGFTVPAVAEELGRSVKSIEGLVTRARRELATRLDTSSDEGGL